MGIGVTARAILERNRTEDGHRLSQRIDRRTEPRSQVTLGTRDVPMLTGEWVGASGMIETGGVLPIADVMTPCARTIESPAMSVGVTARAVTLEADPAGRRATRRQGRGS